MNQFSSRCIALASLQTELPLPKKAFKYMDPRTMPTHLRVGHLTVHICSDSFDNIVTYIDESDLRNEIRTAFEIGSKCKILTTSSPPLVPP